MALLVSGCDLSPALASADPRGVCTCMVQRLVYFALAFLSCNWDGEYLAKRTLLAQTVEAEKSVSAGLFTVGESVEGRCGGFYRHCPATTAGILRRFTLAFDVPSP